MDDILASIRRILAEDEAADPSKASPPTSVSEPPAHQNRTGVLELSTSMIVEEHGAATPELTPEPVAMTVAPPLPPPAPPVELPPGPALETLVAPEAAAASAASVGALMRHLANERSLLVTRNGPSLEDVIRDEMRPLLKQLLKQWLDANLPALVERQVRAEIARVVDRSVT